MKNETTKSQLAAALNKHNVRCQLKHPFPKLYCAECGEIGWHGWLLPILFGVLGFIAGIAGCHFRK